MSSNAHFKICIILSTFIHLTLLHSRPFMPFIQRSEMPSQRIELTYFQESPAKDVVIKNIKPIVSSKTPGASTPLMVETYKKVEIDLKPEESTSLQVEEIKTVEPMDSASEDGEVLENYYLKVREMIKSALEKNGKQFTKEGEVYIKFVISRNGDLRDLALYKTSTKDISSLEVIAIKGIKDASPFPTFAGEIDKKELPFKIPIRFTLRH